ncbi:D-amino acid dehydrogenase small subunit [Azospira sp. I13]|uniref:D-amino acid dehydrogenase n=1 Tax=Azospira sp. I13 TaxID=1765050 RepID=UPI000D4FC7B3|nr:D-amino acid dehydrogenase [Azospira sp. I13]GBG02245.1 D-amino acid dehydrogenase small subunit [Azospira sp. I13]
MRVIVLGAGVVGVTSAWYLAQAGHEVTVVDRQPGAALETSFANGGQISVCHAEPWANPRTPFKALQWFGKEDAPLLFRLRWDPALLAWSVRFLAQCTPGRTRENIRRIVALALYSRGRLQALRQELTLAYDQRSQGILHIYTQPEEFAAACRAAALMREFGLDREPVDAARCVAIEPALAGIQSRLVGGDFTPSDESGDAHQFTRLLAEKAAARGVQFRYGCTIEKIAVAGGQVAGVVAGGDLLLADAYVVALGSYSPHLLQGTGVAAPIYPGKGYSATIPLGPDSVAPSVSLTDDERKIVISRLGDRLRVAGTAEFNGYNLDLNPVRCQALLQRALELFPELRPAAEPLYWCGLRPVTPSNVPLVGRTRLPNLWLNTGHGTLGWTLSCGSAAALADLISGKRPEPDFPFLGTAQP